MTNIEYLNALIAEGEGQRVEFKQSFSTDLDKEIVAFANSEGGSIFIGITDDGKIKGSPWTNKLSSQVIDLARNCDPSILISVVKHERDVVELRIAEGQTKPYQCSRGFFIRLGASSIKVKQHELVEMVRAQPNYHFDEAICRDFIFPKQIAESNVSLFLKRANIKTKIKPAALLLSLDTAKETSEGIALRNGGVLFFAQNPQKFFPESTVTCVKYEGLDKVRIENRIDCNGSILEILEMAFNFTKQYIKRSQTISGLRHKNISNYPEIALREAIVNAVMHRDYSYDLSHIYINIFEDRIEIDNPGSLPRGITENNLGQLSIRRNRLIADLLYRAGYVEKLGSGFIRMQKALEENGNPPFEIQSNQFFQIRFRPNLGSTSFAKLTQRQRQILTQFTKGEQSLSAKNLSHTLGVSQDTTVRELKVLIKSGLVVSDGSGKNTVYRLGVR